MPFECTQPTESTNVRRYMVVVWRIRRLYYYWLPSQLLATAVAAAVAASVYMFAQRHVVYAMMSAWGDATAIGCWGHLITGTN